MKTQKWLWLFVAVIGLVLYACSESEDGVKLGKTSHSLCKNIDARSSGGYSLGNQSVNYKVKYGVLYIDLINYHMNCGADGADVKLDLNEETNEIRLTPYDLGYNSANCICPIDISTTVSGLKYGEKYECIIERMNISFSFVCRNAVKGTVTP